VQGYLDQRPPTAASVKTLFVSDRKRPMSAVHFWRLIRQAAQRAGILKPVTPHVLRHSFASMGVSHGMSLPMVGRLLGHTQASTTQRYAHLAASPLQMASEDIAGRLAAALKPAKRAGGAKSSSAK